MLTLVSGTWGVVTSVIVKAYDASLLASISTPIVFSTGNITDSGPITSNETFWKAMNIYFAYVPTICNAGGVGYNFIYNFDGVLKFFLLFLMPNMTLAQANMFANPMYEAFIDLGINLTNPNVPTKRSIKSPSLVNPAPTPYPSRGPGMENVRLASRLIPRTSFDVSSPTFNTTMAAFKRAVAEGGYTLHGANHCPSEAVAGYPNNAIVPAYRETAGHMQLWDSGYAIGSPELKATRWNRFNKYMQLWRDVSPGAGSYMGEADPAEPNWQQAFYGDHYPRLLSIKNKWDPWGLFWAKTAVGSEGWEAQSPFPLQVPTQNVSIRPLFRLENYFYVHLPTKVPLIGKALQNILIERKGCLRFRGSLRGFTSKGRLMIAMIQGVYDFKSIYKFLITLLQMKQKCISAHYVRDNTVTIAIR